MQNLNSHSLVTSLVVILVLVGIFFAGVRYGTLQSAGSTGSHVLPSAPSPFANESDIFSIRPSEAPRGSGPFLLIEYSDFECPFCQRFHPTVQELVDEGLVTWVYRHLPLDFHPTADEAAIISECVRERLGGDAFWQYTDQVFASSAPPSEEKYRALALSLGLSSSDAAACLSEGSPERAIVSSHQREARLLGIEGTPGSLVVDLSTGEFIDRIPGALDANSIRGLLQTR